MDLIHMYLLEYLFHGGALNAEQQALHKEPRSDLKAHAIHGGKQTHTGSKRVEGRM